MAPRDAEPMSPCIRRGSSFLCGSVSRSESRPSPVCLADVAIGTQYLSRTSLSDAAWPLEIAGALLSDEVAQVKSAARLRTKTTARPARPASIATESHTISAVPPGDIRQSVRVEDARVRTSAEPSVAPRRPAHSWANPRQRAHRSLASAHALASDSTQAAARNRRRPSFFACASARR
jgi:hypothetical protein